MQKQLNRVAFSVFLALRSAHTKMYACGACAAEKHKKSPALKLFLYPDDFNRVAFSVFLALLAPVAFAQTTPAKLEWPRSFTGQPDFAFTRDEAFAEARARAARAGVPSPQLPGLLSVATDNTTPDPLRLRVVAISPTLGLDGEVISTTETAPATLLDKLMGNVSSLPVYAAPTAPDVVAFKASIGALISQTVAAWQPDANRYDFSSIINTLTLQAIVTSPQHYAIINGNRYTEGSSLLIRVPLSVPDTEILNALQAALPETEMLDAATLAAYQTASEDALASFASARSANPRLGQQMLNVSALVQRIEPRKVQLLVNGKTYDLAIKFAY